MERFFYSLAGKPKRTNLKRVLDALNALNNPHIFPTNYIHVAGTNGKGSTSFFLYSALLSRGETVGLFTSPHLIFFNERIRINGRVATKGELEWAAKTIKKKVMNRGLEVSFFEALTCASFLIFRENRPDWVIMEVGVGGKLDPTNVISPALSIITRISKDHTGYLGNTTEAIAQNKAGIIKPGVPVVTSGQTPDAMEVIATAAARNGAPLAIHGRDFRAKRSPSSIGSLSGEEFTYIGMKNTISLKIKMLGEHQIENSSLALAALEILGILDERAIRGISNAFWRGRFEVLSLFNKTVVIDAAHNPDGFCALRKTLLEKFKGKRIAFFVAFLKDKDFVSMLRQIEDLGRVFLSEVSYRPRALTIEDALPKLEKEGINVCPVGGAEKAIEAAKAVKEEIVVFAGSIYFVGEVMSKILSGGFKDEALWLP